MEKLSYKDVPSRYDYCTVSDCSVAGHCLRHLALQGLTKEPRLVSIVNPKRTNGSESCEFYRSAKPQVFGRGFTQMEESMLPRQYAAFMRKMRTRFGRTAYFERRRGQRLCTPQDVAYIRKVLASLGLADLEFDSYVEQPVW